MWGSAAAGGGAMHPSMYGSTMLPSQQVQQSQQQQKHDIFVGNLAFTTTEQEIHQVFSEIGRVVKVRMVTDLETGKPRGFCFVEFEDPQAALSAIRNMNDVELNGRKLRVNFSNSSHLEALAGKLGMDLSSSSTSGGGGTQSQSQRTTTSTDTSSAVGGTASGTMAVAQALKGFSKSEMYDVVAKLKDIADKDPDEARRLLSGHPQLPEAMLHLMSKLEMITTPILGVSAAAAGVSVMPTTTTATSVPATTTVTAKDPRTRPVDPRAAAAAAAATSTATTTTTSQPPPPPPPPTGATAAPTAATTAATAATHPMDPRQRMLASGGGTSTATATTTTASTMVSDPRQQQQQQQYMSTIPSRPPPPPPPPRPTTVAATVGAPTTTTTGSSVAQQLDPALVQQVMSLTEEQIQQLPPDKQTSIRMLRQQITGGSS